MSVIFASACSKRRNAEYTRLQELANRGDDQIASPIFGTILQGSNIVLHQTAVERWDTWFEPFFV
jgi:hypothetical protein